LDSGRDLEWEISWYVCMAGWLLFFVLLLLFCSDLGFSPARLDDKRVVVWETSQNCGR
jgi:hypothetical protein